MKISAKTFFIRKILFIILFSSIYAQNDDYEDYEDYEKESKDTVIIDGMKYARVINDSYFDDLEYDEGMWSVAPGYGFGIIKGAAFSSIPAGYSFNIITPYGFDIGPFRYNISFAFGKFESEYHKIAKDNVGLIINDSTIAISPIYIGIGGDLNFLGSIYSEGHIGIVGEGPGFRGFLGYNLGNLGTKLGNDLDLNLMIGSEFYISSKIVSDGPPSYWATFSLRGLYSFHSLFDS